MTAMPRRERPLPVMPEVVHRWEAAGGTWRVTEVGSDSATLELCRCDGGEVADRLELNDPRDMRWAREVRTAE